ncbi:TonB-dependent receptor [Phenylobacterium deserti]|uniref:TonB-dependent receptor n=1 Tax=Phenylobacterium deserti TaxID=1914756 RepID=A0A328AGU4_9CAUL|nr:TonB-dependent receptor [Phenylobacterium deserti]RAK52664.1 TonB-dependent receptor [Phenylobacterium deserti]
MTRSDYLISAGLTVALCGGSPAAAQVQPEELEAVVVTAQRFGSGLTRASAALGADDIRARPLGADITQSLVKIPGVQVSTGDSRGGSFSFELYMRGLTDEQIGLTIDGVPTGDSRFNGGSPPQRFIESSNIGRIDVSQSAGDIGAPSRFALGGFIDFVTDDPRRQAGSAAEAGAGSYDFRRVYGRLDTGEFAGLSAYLSASHQENDVWAGRRSRGSERDHIEIKALKRFEGGSTIRARVSYNDQVDNDFNIVTLGEFQAAPGSDRATDVISGIPARDVDFGGALGGARHDLLAYVNVDLKLGEAVSVAFNPYYQTLEGESFRYQDRSRVLTGGDPRRVTGYGATGGAQRPALTTLRNSNAVGGPADMRVTPRDRERYGVTSEIRAAFGRHNLRAGGWWEGGDSSERRNFYPIINPAQGITYDRDRLSYVEYERTASVETTMFYVQDEVRAFGDRLKLDLGATWYDVAYDARSPLEYRANVKFSQNSDLNPKIGAAWTLGRGFELFGGWARNFAGIPEDAFLGSTAVIRPGDLEPVRTENLDAGVRFVSDRAAFLLQAYHVDLKNNVGIVPRDSTAALEPDEVVRGNVATRAANIAGQVNRGVELSSFYDFGAVDLYAAYAYQDAKHEDPAPGSAARRALASVGVIGGKRVRDIPEHSLYAQAGWKPTSALRLELNVRYVGERVGGHIIEPVTFREAGVETIDAYTVAGLMAAYDFRPAGGPDLRLQVNVDNLFDEAFLGAVSGSTATQPEFGLQTGATVRTLDRYFVGAPRTVTVSLRAQF